MRRLAEVGYYVVLIAMAFVALNAIIQVISLAIGIFTLSGSSVASALLALFQAGLTMLGLFGFHYQYSELCGREEILLELPDVDRDTVIGAGGICIMALGITHLFPLSAVNILLGAVVLWCGYDMYKDVN